MAWPPAPRPDWREGELQLLLLLVGVGLGGGGGAGDDLGPDVLGEDVQILDRDLLRDQQWDVLFDVDQLAIGEVTSVNTWVAPLWRREIVIFEGLLHDHSPVVGLDAAGL